MTNRELFIYLIAFLSLGFSLFFSYENHSNLNELSKKIQLNAKETESLKMDFELLKRRQEAISSLRISKENMRDLLSLRQKLKIAKSELAKLKSDANSKEREEYLEREERIWENLLNYVKQTWSLELNKKLSNLRVEQGDMDLVITNFQTMLDNAKDLQLHWYRDEVSDDEFKEEAIEIGKNFYSEMEQSVGPNLASIVLSIVFPDVNFRRALFDVEK